MDLNAITSTIKAVFTLFKLTPNIKYWKKVTWGIHDLDAIELQAIDTFFTERIKPAADLQARSEKLEYNQSLNLEIELRKIPVLKQLSLNEILFLYKNEVDLQVYFDIVIAKGDFYTNYGVIEWENTGYKLKEKINKLPKWGVSFVILVMLFGLMVLLFDAIPRISNTFNFFNTFSFLTVIILIFWIPFVTSFDNYLIAYKKLKKNEKYPLIFKDSKKDIESE